LLAVPDDDPRPLQIVQSEGEYRRRTRRDERVGRLLVIVVVITVAALVVGFVWFLMSSPLSN